MGKPFHKLPSEEVRTNRQPFFDDMTHWKPMQFPKPYLKLRNNIVATNLPFRKQCCIPKMNRPTVSLSLESDSLKKKSGKWLRKRLYTKYLLNKFRRKELEGSLSSWIGNVTTATRLMKNFHFVENKFERMEIDSGNDSIAKKKPPTSVGSWLSTLKTF